MADNLTKIAVAALLSALAFAQQSPPKAAQTYEVTLGKMGEWADPPTRLRALCESIVIFNRMVNADEIWLENLHREQAPPQQINRATDRLMLNAMRLDKFRREVQDLQGELLRDYPPEDLPDGGNCPRTKSEANDR